MAKTFNLTYTSMEAALGEKVKQHGILATCIMEKVAHGILDFPYLLKVLRVLVMNMKILMIKLIKGSATCREDYFP